MEVHSDIGATRMTRVMIGGGQELFRKGLLALLERRSDIEVVGEGATPGEIEHAVCLRRPDVAVVDAELVDCAGHGTLRRASAISQRTRFLVLSSAASPASVRRLFDAGAFGVITRNAHVDELIDAIASILDGQRYLHPALGARLVRCHQAVDPLTDREVDIARKVALGTTNLEIASAAHISVRTVETHRSHVMTKLGLHTRAELVRWALDSRVIGPTPEDAR